MRCTSDTVFRLMYETGGERHDQPSLWTRAAVAKRLGISEDTAERNMKRVMVEHWGRAAVVLWDRTETIRAGRVVRDQHRTPGGPRRYWAIDLEPALARAKARDLSLTCMVPYSSYMFRAVCITRAIAGLMSQWDAELIGERSEILMDSATI